ncbi:putative exosome complex component rrp40 [Prunus yedoensis var. nudiflora]|uniref:Ribosomal RNA-processing protein 40 n=1 Tax=Prunus yedoensis var. nudiflora TaxID=2094558 RepID=A0A314XIR7_PRUYE|nr:putative exosome complex component rrp40 [Prunus yedoensis var. nudiflora]
MAEKASGSPASFVDQSVVPGDVVLDLTSMANQTIKLGGGLRQFSKPNKYWVETSQKRYVPCAGDSVLGIVADSKADNFLVDIKGPTIAFLPVLAFEGGTRRNIPKFEVGTLLYVRVVKANPGMNPELSCIDASGKAAEYGPLKDGYMFECSTGLSRMLLSSPRCPVLEALGKNISFETAIGLNGRVWVNAGSPSTVIVVANAIMNAESLSGCSRELCSCTIKILGAFAVLVRIGDERKMVTDWFSNGSIQSTHVANREKLHHFLNDALNATASLTCSEGSHCACSPQRQ